MINETLYSSRTEEWGTPQNFFDQLNAEFNFTLDPCATAENAKCEQFFTKEIDGLAQDWGTNVVFCNPPYGKEIGLWMEKCLTSAEGGATVVALVHARTDTRWFHNWVYKKADEIRFIKGRLKFGGSLNSAPFPSLIAIYRPK